MWTQVRNSSTSQPFPHYKSRGQSAEGFEPEMLRAGIERERHALLLERRFQSQAVKHTRPIHPPVLPNFPPLHAHLSPDILTLA